MAKILLIADAHITSNPDWTRHLEALREIVAEEKPDICISVGDELHQPASLGSSTEKMLQEYLSILNQPEREIQRPAVYCLKGTQSHVGNFMESSIVERNPDIMFINEIRETEIPALGKCLFIPEAYEDLPYSDYLKKSYDHVFLHGVIAGFISGLHEDEQTERTHPKAPTFSANSFNADFVFAGHYHQRGFETNDNGCVVGYVGSFVTNTFGEIDESGKGVIIFNTVTKEMRTVHNKNDIKYLEKEILSFVDLQSLILLRDSDTSLKVRALITDNTPPSVRGSILSKIKYKDTTSAGLVEDTQQLEIQKEKNSLYSTAFKDDGLESAILVYANDNEIAVDKGVLTGLMQDFEK